MSYELSQRFYFDAAHTLQRSIDADSSKRIHGHTYHAEVCISGMPDPESGMTLDLGFLRSPTAHREAETAKAHRG